MRKFKVLSNGIKIPSIGFGTYKSGDNNETAEIVKYALECGYRQIDTASFYGNEVGIGNAIKESKVKREDIFLVTKLWNDDHGYDKTIEAFNNSLKRLQIEYLDLYLIHWPNKLNAETWRAFEDLYKAGKVKAIGVCNFKIQLIAWSPIMRGKLFTNELMLNLSEKYQKSVAQVILRWHIQRGVIPIPKSSNKTRIKENLNVFDFEISNEDMKSIYMLNEGNNASITGVPENTTYLKFD